VNTTLRMAYASTSGWNKGEGRVGGRRGVGWYGTSVGYVFLVGVQMGIIFFCLLVLCFLLYVSLFGCFYFFFLYMGVEFDGHGAGFIGRGVVVGGGFRSLCVLRTLRPAGCLEFG